MDQRRTWRMACVISIGSLLVAAPVLGLEWGKGPMPSPQMAAFWTQVHAQDDEDFDAAALDDPELSADDNGGADAEAGAEDAESWDESTDESAALDESSDSGDAASPQSEDPATQAEKPATQPEPTAPSTFERARQHLEDCVIEPQPQPCDNCDSSNDPKEAAERAEIDRRNREREARCPQSATAWPADGSGSCSASPTSRGYCTSGRRLIADGSDLPPVCVTSTGADHADGFRAEYCAVQSPRYQQLRGLLQQAGTLDQLVAQLNGYLKLPADVSISMSECGRPNAYYHRPTRSIQLCYELVDGYFALYQGDGLRGEALNAAVDRALAFVFYQKLGSALIDVLDLPMHGNETAAVDQIASYLVAGIDGREGRAILDGARALFRLASQQTTLAAEAADAQAQRLDNLACWAYGQNPQQGADLVADGTLSAERAGQCPGEWQRMDIAWSRLLKPVLLR